MTLGVVSQMFVPWGASLSFNSAPNIKVRGPLVFGARSDTRCLSALRTFTVLPDPISSALISNSIATSCGVLQVASKDWHIAMVSTTVETDNPEAEIKPGLDILGAITEKWVPVLL